MLIPIRFTTNPDHGESDDESMVQAKRTKSSLPERMLLVELQGIVEAREASSLEGLPLGNLSMLKNDRATLVIGNHLLEGKMTKLSKPLLAIHKAPKDTESDGTTYEIVSLIRHKFLFTAGPTPLSRSDPKVTCPLGVDPVDHALTVAEQPASKKK